MSAGKDKRENFERLLREGKLGGMALQQNLDLMLASGVDPKLPSERLEKGVARALPFRFVTAARNAPKVEEGIEKDVSGSMDGQLSRKSENKRMDAAAGLGILLREKAEDFVIATFRMLAWN